MQVVVKGKEADDLKGLVCCLFIMYSLALYRSILPGGIIQYTVQKVVS